MDSTDDTIKPPQPTHRERKSARLQAAIDRVQAEIAVVRTEHHEKFREWDEAAASAARMVRYAETITIACDLRAASARTGLEALQEQLRKAEQSVVDTRAALYTAIEQQQQLRQRREKLEAERAAALDQPNRHLAALARDLAKLERRMALHQARQPLRALVPQ